MEAKALFEHLAQSQPGGVKAGLLRTFQRRVKLWRVAAGPKKEVFFTQDHKPGEVLGIKHIPIYHELHLSLRLCAFARGNLYTTAPLTAQDHASNPIHSD